MRHILLKGTVGSTAYGLDHAGSDIDTLGVFVYDIMDYLRLTEPEESVVTHEPDVTLHEIRKYLKLALKCNPTVLELLYLDKYTDMTEAGRALVAMRHSFLSAPAVKNAYLGYATAQLRRLEDREGARRVKHAKHMARLLLQGHELYTTGTMSLKVDREWMDDFLSKPLLWGMWFEEQENKFEYAKSVLPEKPDQARVEDYLYRLMERGPL